MMKAITTKGLITFSLDSVQFGCKIADVNLDRHCVCKLFVCFPLDCLICFHSLQLCFWKYRPQPSLLKYNTSGVEYIIGKLKTVLPWQMNNLFICQYHSFSYMCVLYFVLFLRGKYSWFVEKKFKNVKMSDSGNFQCVGYNRNGSTTVKNITLDVLG